MPESNLFGEFARQAAAHPDAVAIVSGEGQTTSYGALLARAEGIARRLHRRGVAPEEPIGVLMRRTPDIVASLLAILRMGGACVPFDLENPPDRQRRILGIAGCRLVIGDPENAGPLRTPPESAPEFMDIDGPGPDGDACELPPVAPGGARLAYLLFTSGSTGEPKGVEIEHRNVMSMLVATIDLLRVTAADRLLCVATIGFDVALAEIYLPLVSGGSLLLRSREVWIAPHRLAEDIRKHGVTILSNGPSVWGPALDEVPDFPRVRIAIATGEAISPALARRIAGHADEMWNLYGPTETVTWISGHRVAAAPADAGPEDGFSAPIGHALANTLLLVRGEDGRILGPGEAGEVWIGGANVARGYRGNPALTEERFQPVGPRGERCYRTGDLAEWNTETGLLYLGRNDEQIKVHGIRIEPQEVESALLREPRVAATAATWFNTPDGSRAIMAAIVVRAGTTLSSRDLYESLHAILPASMIPSRFVFLDALPRLPNGKVDRKLLRQRAASAAPAAPTATASRPLSPTETAVREIWCRILGLATAGPDDHFFDLGGDSFAAVKVSLELESRLAIKLPVKALFETPTLATLAARIDRDRNASGSATPEFIVRLADGAGVPVFFNNADLRATQGPASSLPCPLYAVSHVSLGDRFFGANTVAELAALHLAAIRQIQPTGPYRLAGFSFGALVTLEIARRLATEGQEIDCVFLLDPMHPRRVAGEGRSEIAVPRPRGSRPEGLETIATGWFARMAHRLGHAAIRFHALHPNPISAWLVPKDRYPAYFRHVDRLVQRHVVRPHRGRVTALFSGTPEQHAVWKTLLDSDARLLHTGIPHEGLFGPEAIRLWMPLLVALVGGDREVSDAARGAVPAPRTTDPAPGEPAPSPSEAAVAVAATPGPRKDPGSAAPLSFHQQRRWFLEQLHPEAAGQNLVVAFRVRGDLDAAVLKRCLAELSRRHEILRSVVTSIDGKPMLVVRAEAAVSTDVLDRHRVAPGLREAETRQFATGEARRPIDPSREPMMRTGLLQWAADDHSLVLAFHPLAFDDASESIVRRELAALYEAFSRGQPAPLPAMPLQYADYAAWQRAWLRGDALERHLAACHARLAGAPPVLELPTDFPQPAVPAFRAAAVPWTLDAASAQGLRELARREDSTLFATLLAAWGVFLARLSGQEDIVIGAPIRGRGHAGLEGLIGNFADTLAIRADLSGNPTFRETLRRVREATAAAHADVDLPFEKLLEELRPECNPSHPPVFQVTLELSESSRPEPVLGGLDVRAVGIPDAGTMVNLALVLRGDGPGLRGTLAYRTDLFAPATIARWLAHFETLLRGIVADPARRIGELPLLTEAERSQVLRETNPGRTPYPDDRCVHGLFEDRAEKTPDAVAVVFGESTVTYGELNRRANRVAHALRGEGAARGMPIGVHLERSVEQLAVILGILKCGGCYVPLPPEYPAARRRFMLEDSATTRVVGREPLPDDARPPNCRTVTLASIAAAAAAAAAGPAWEANPAAGAMPDDLAYVVFTSGSIGEPKGVMVEHRSIARLVFGQSYATFGPDRVFLQLAPVAFDASTFEIWGALLHGAKLVVVPEGPLDPAAVGALVRTHRVTTLWLTAALFNELVASRPETLSGIGEILAGGEALSPRHVRMAHQRLGPDTRIVNGYGPTECTTFACCHRIPHGFVGDRIPIGRPIANTRAYVLDAKGDAVPFGVTGELYLAGPGLARGYLNRPELTAEHFVPDPFAEAPTARMYRTGDLVRWLPDGTLDFIGRRDRQVKIRGFRIELGEIERVLAEHPGVDEALVESRARPDGAKTLVAYWKSRDGARPDGQGLAQFVRTRLPGFMVPSAWMPVAAWPLTPTGKIDRRALPSPWTDPSSPGERARPDSMYEAVLHGIFTEVLARESVGLDDNFFACGGNWLRALQLIARVERHLGLRLPASVLFEDATVRKLAQRIEALRRVCPEGVSFPGTDPLVTLQEGDPDKTLFVFPGGYGDESEFLTHAWICHRHLGPGYAMKAFRNRAWRGAAPLRPDLRGIAADCIADMRRVQPRGPWHLIGLCVGGNLAFEVALQLQEAGEPVGMLAMADTMISDRWAYPKRCRIQPPPRVRRWIANTMFLGLPWFRPWMTRSGRRLFVQSALSKLGRPAPVPGSPVDKRLVEDRYLHDEWCHYQNGEGYLRRLMVPPRGMFRGRLDLLLSTEMASRTVAADWARHATGGAEILELPGPHATFLVDGGDRIAALYRRRLELSAPAGTRPD